MVIAFAVLLLPLIVKPLELVAVFSGMGVHVVVCVEGASILLGLAVVASALLLGLYHMNGGGFALDVPGLGLNGVGLRIGGIVG